MAKDKATDKELGILHGKVATMMTKALDSAEEAEHLLDKHLADDLPGDIIDYLEKQKASSPALFTAIAKFLKDNDITCQIEENPQMSELQTRLAHKRKAVGNIIPISED